MILFLGFSLLCMWHWIISNNIKSVCMAGDTCVGTMAYAHKHVFLLPREISPGPVHRFSCVCLWNFQEHGVFVEP